MGRKIQNQDVKTLADLTGAGASASDLINDTKIYMTGAAKQLSAAVTDRDLVAVMVGDSGSGGTKGLVPAPAAGDTAANKFLKADGTWVTPSGLGGGGSGGINYITNGEATDSTTGWATYADAAGASPVDGTGGAPNISFTRTTVPGEILRGNASFKMSKSAANRQGEGVSYDFVVDRQDRVESKRLFIGVDFSTTANFASDDVKVFVYDKDGASLLGVLDLDNNNGGLFFGSAPRRFSGWFYTTPGNDDYRLIFHIASTSALAWDLFLDNVRVSPESVVPGAIVQDLGPITPTGSWTTNTTYSGRAYRIGSQARLEIKLVLSGAPTAANLTINYPASFPIDSTRVSSTTADAYFLGRGQVLDSGALNYPIDARYDGTTSFKIQAHNASATYSSQGSVTQAVPVTFAAGDEINIVVEYPVLGWSSGASLSSSEIPLQTIQVLAEKTSGTHTTNGFYQDVSWTETKDNFGAFTGTSFVVPKTATYRINSLIEFASNTTGIRVCAILKNGALAAQGSAESASVTFICSVSAELNLVRGDSIRIQAYQNSGGNLNYASASATPSRLSISEIPDFTIFSAYADTSDVELFLDTGNGHGSTNTKIRRFGSIRKQSGQNQYFAYADTAADGMSVTIKIPGVYSINYVDRHETTVAAMGISVNSSVLTTNIQSVTYAQGKRTLFYSPATTFGQVGLTLRLSAGDIVRAHTDGSQNNTGDGVLFQLTRVSP